MKKIGFIVTKVTTFTIVVEIVLPEVVSKILSGI
jgi:hypothetical protein